MLYTPKLGLLLTGGISQQLSSCTTSSTWSIYLSTKGNLATRKSEKYKETATTDLWLLEENKLSSTHTSSLLF